VAVLAPAISVLISCGRSSSTPAPTAPTIRSFTGNNNGSVASGTSVTLSWTVSNATSVAIAGVDGITGASTKLTLGAGDTVAVTPADTTTYTLTATNLVGGTTAKYAIQVNNVASNLNCTTGGTLYTVGTGSTVVKVASAAN